MNSDTPRTNEEIIDAAHCAECGYEVVLADAMRKLEREIVELGKEREALENDTLGYINEIAQLKRELAEARGQMDTFINQWSETNNSLQRENLALSSAYQRQKEALENILKMTAGHYGIELEANKALAETPDGSLLERVIALAQMAESESEFTINKLGHRVSTGGLVQLRNEARSLLSTLQPDHQK